MTVLCAQTLNRLLMGPRRKKTPIYVEDDSLSEELDEISEDPIAFPPPKKIKLPPKPCEELQWTEKYRPTSSSQVCINPRKAKEIRDALGSMINGELRVRFLALTGPSGSSKSTLVKCLSKELVGGKIGKRQSAQDFLETADLEVVEYLESELLNIPQPDHFSDFLDGCRYRVGLNLAVILIEELPNVFHPKTLESFRRSLALWIYSSAELPPLVLCLTEVEIQSEDRNKSFYNIENNLTLETLLGSELLRTTIASGLVQRIKVLPVAKTFLKKTLGHIVASEKLRIPPSLTDQVFQPMYESGDIRSLICNLQFWAMLPLFMKVSALVRENHISLFHAIGKVIHSSSKFAGLDEDTNDYLSIQEVFDGYNNIGLLHLALLENYAVYNDLQFDISVAAKIVDKLSLNDTFPESIQDFGLRAVRSELRSVGETPGKTQPMKFPRHFKMLREANKVQRDILDYVRYIGRPYVLFQTANLYDGFLLPAIYNSFQYKLRYGTNRYNYNRLGGSFKPLYADGDLPVLESDKDAVSGATDQFQVVIAEKIGQEGDEEEDSMSEDIENSDDELNDDLDDMILKNQNRTFTSERHRIDKNVGVDQKVSTTEKKMAIRNATTTDSEEKITDLDNSLDFLDDLQLEMLVSQGRL